MKLIGCALYVSATIALFSLADGVTAQAKTPKAKAKVSPLFDDGYAVINLNNEVHAQSGTRPAKVEYSPAMRLRVFGVAQGDALKVRWRKGKKLLVERRCTLTLRKSRFGEGSVGLADRCWRRDAAIKAHGNLTVEVRFVDDSEETETLLRTMRVQVARYWRLDRVIRGKAIHSPRYQVVGSDLMGLAYGLHVFPDDITPHGDLYFYYWSTLANDNSNYRDPSWRCKLDGASVPEMNVDGHKVVESIADIKAQDVRMRGRKHTSEWFAWRLMWIKPQLVWGKSRNPKAPDTVSTSRYNISKHPGRYVCKLRDEGETVREFSFTVRNDGLLAPHGAQSESGLSLSPGAVFVNMRVVPNKAESSFDAKAAKKSVAFGRKWPKSNDVKAHLKGFPRSYGKAVPRKPRGAR